MVLRIFTVLLVLFVAGCAPNSYELKEPVSPSLEGMQTVDDFFTHGQEVNHDITTNAIDNLMINVCNL